MNKKDKRKFTTAFKVKVAMEAVKGQSTIAQLAKSHDLHPSQIMGWKKTLSERAGELFEAKGKKSVSSLPDNAALYEQIGRLQMELSFLKKKLGPCA
jgi:transposase-like protein